MNTVGPPHTWIEFHLAFPLAGWLKVCQMLCEVLHTKKFKMNFSFSDISLVLIDLNEGLHFLLKAEFGPMTHDGYHNLI